MGSEPKVTYVTLSADSEDARAGFNAGIARVQREYDQTMPLFINGRARNTRKTTASTSPLDTSVIVGHASDAAPADMADAIAAAEAAFPSWRQTPWSRRAELLGDVAKRIRDERFYLSSLIIAEMGKSRTEALGEVEETADLITYYNDRMTLANGFVHPMDSLSPQDRNTSVMRPYGVWAVISPWNFPCALLGAPVAAALLTGNTVVAKPSSETPIIAAALMRLFQAAGLPDGVLNFITGSGRMVGDAVVKDPRVAGATFTGSYEVGFHQLFKQFSVTYPRPCIVEMGGKNPALVMDSADLDKAVAGVYRSAFGMNGHKCSACSRVYVHEAVADAFVERLLAKVRATEIGNPLERDVFVGSLATKQSLNDYLTYSQSARNAGALIEGGVQLQDGPFAKGLFVRPTVMRGLPEDHELVRQELFVPMLHIQTVRSFAEAMQMANNTTLGLTAGCFSQNQKELEAFFEDIEAGVVYVNRAAGATTGAWPGVQPFGGWKGSGSTGKNIGGLYSLSCYLREQSRTVVE